MVTNYKKTIILLSIFVLIKILIAVPGMSQQGCMIRGQTYQKLPAQEEYRGTVGQPVFISIETKPSSLPQGYFAANNVKIIEAPEKPEVVSGHPEIRVICHEPGEYIFQITTSILSKSSCGGIDSCSMQPHTVKVIIEGP